MVLSKIYRAERVRLVCIGLSASALAAMALTVKFATPAEAKTPGSTYCYYGVCHRVKTIDETQALVGVEESITASHYDDCKQRPLQSVRAHVVGRAIPCRSPRQHREPDLSRRHDAARVEPATRAARSSCA